MQRGWERACGEISLLQGCDSRIRRSEDAGDQEQQMPLKSPGSCRRVRQDEEVWTLPQRLADIADPYEACSAYCDLRRNVHWERMADDP